MRAATHRPDAGDRRQQRRVRRFKSITVRPPTRADAAIPRGFNPLDFFGRRGSEAASVRCDHERQHRPQEFCKAFHAASLPVHDTAQGRAQPAGTERAFYGGISAHPNNYEPNWEKTEDL